MVSVRCDAQIRVAIEGIADIGEAVLPVGATRLTSEQTLDVWPHLRLDGRESCGWSCYTALTV
jgi:hypothetical protein